MKLQAKRPCVRIPALLLAFVLSMSALGSTALAAPATSLPGGYNYGYHAGGYDGYIWEVPQTKPYSRYFYNQLTDFEKAIYACIDEKTDNPAATADFTGANAITFHNLGAPGTDEIFHSFMRVCDAFLLDNPHKYWVRIAGIGGINIGRAGETASVSFRISPAYSSTLYSNTQKAIDRLVAAASGATDADRVWSLYAALASTADYHTAAAQKGPEIYPDAFTIGGLGKDGKLVCEGYAKVFKTVCDRIGIPCVLAPGIYEGTEQHMWVMVRLDGAWYAIDPTHGDQASGPMRSTFLAGSKTNITGFGDSFVFENSYRAIRSNVFINTYTCAGFSWPGLAQQAHSFVSGRSGSGESNTGSGFSGTGGGLSATAESVPVSAAQAAAAARAAVAEAKAAGSSTAKVKLKNPGQIDNAALLAITGAVGTGMNAEIFADSLSADGKSVAVRLVLDAAKAAATTAGTPGASLNLSASVSGAAVTRTEQFFTKYFRNRLWVVAFTQQDSFGQDVQVAVKPNLAGADVKNLYFYAYNAKTNAYKPITKPNAWQDNTGYLHFTTPYAGSIVISDSPLTRK